MKHLQELIWLFQHIFQWHSLLAELVLVSRDDAHVIWHLAIFENDHVVQTT